MSCNHKFHPLHKKRLNVWRKIRYNFTKYGGQNYTISEPITITQHSLQTYKRMIEITNDSNLHVSAFLHDFGHFPIRSREYLLTPFLSSSSPLKYVSVCPKYPIDPITGINDEHERNGSDWLMLNDFPPDVYMPVRLHVLAKRYLCTVNEEYKNSLSTGSALSLELQGGLLTVDECAMFETLPYAEESLLLRNADDQGKNVNVRDLPDIRELKELVMSVIN